MLQCASVMEALIARMHQTDVPVHKELSCAARHSMLFLCLVLLQQQNVRSDAYDCEALQAAAKDGHVDVCRLLKGAAIASKQH